MSVPPFRDLASTWDPNDVEPSRDGASLVEGDQVGGYVVAGLAGRGATAVVYRVRHRHLRTVHALKVLERLSYQRQVRFLQEGRIQAALDHPNVVVVRDVLDVRGSPGLLMDYVDGPTLDRWLEDRRPHIEEVLGVFSGICEGLAAAHDRDIVHRDLKPANVLLEVATLRPRITDFGLARAIGAVTQTRTGAILGTPAYMAPEQARDASRVDRRTDIFALGCLLYEMAYGRRAFEGATVAEVLQAVLFGQVDLPRDPGVPEAVRATLRACLQKDPDRRPEDARQVAAMVRGEAAMPSIALDVGEPEVMLASPAIPPPPDRPYPLLEPYQHPDTFAGRGRELVDILEMLAEDRVLLSVYAASGAGKSSLLRAGLFPALASAGRPCAVDRTPDEPGLARRLLAGLLRHPPRLDDGDWEGFHRALERVRLASGHPPVLVLDQFEDALRRREGEALRWIGPLLAATVARTEQEPRTCHWVLAYRKEFHGEVEAWLRDVLRQARAAGNPPPLPSDLTRGERRAVYALPPIGSPGPRQEPREAARRAFLEAILRPLELPDDRGRPRFGLRFADGHAERLAGAFADARLRQPSAPLAPELQVILHALVNSAEEGVIRVPEPADALLDDALARHLRTKLEACFPGDPDGRRRTQALMALRRLADRQGQREPGLAPAEVERELGPGWVEVMERLSASGVWLVLQVPVGGQLRFVLPHDRLAALVRELTDDPNAWARYRLDPELFEVERLVDNLVEAHRLGDPRAMDPGRASLRRIARARPHIGWNAARRAWWADLQAARRRRNRQRLGWALATVLLLGLAGWRLVAWDARRSLLHAPDGRRGLALLQRVRALDGAGAAVEAVAALDRHLQGWMLHEALTSGRSDLEGIVREAIVRDRPAGAACPTDCARDWVHVPHARVALLPETGQTPRTLVAGPLWIARTEVTRDAWARFDPSRGEPGSRLPMTAVSWYEALAYVTWLGGRLPTPDEWEVAARAGDPHIWPGGADPGPLGAMAWYGDETFSTGVHEVGRLAPNAWGLLDVLGNAWEWTSRLEVRSNGVVAIIRGGGAGDSAALLRFDQVGVLAPWDRAADIGVRPVLDRDPATLP